MRRYGDDGQLSHGDRQEQWQPKKVEAFAGQRAVAVSAGEYHSLALTADGAVWSWGCGDSGRLGHGDTQWQLLPKKIEAFAGQRVVAVSTIGSQPRQSRLTSFSDVAVLGGVTLVTEERPQTVSHR